MNESRVREGERLFAEGDAEEARKTFLSVLEDEPSNLIALSKLAMLAHEDQDLQSAAKLFHRALEGDENHLPSIEGLAEVYTGGKEWERALQYRLRKVDLAPDNAAFHNEAAQLCLELGDQYRAGQLIRRSLEITPDQPDLRDGLTVIEQYLACYSVANTTVGPFVLSNRDMVLRRALAQGVPFGKEEIDRAVQMLGKLGASSWSPRNFVDIGANVGTHTIYAFAAHGFQQGIAVEVAADNFRLLRCNLVLAQLDERVHAVNCGLSSHTGSSHIERSPSNHGDHRVRLGQPSHEGLHGERAWDTAACQLQTFDDTIPADLLDSEGTLVWIDTQGHEAHILAGASSLFESHTPFVIEFWPYGIERQGSSCEDIIQLLASCSVYDLRGDAGRLDATMLASLYKSHLAEETWGRSPHTDLLVIP